jgi:hypothetical protein
MWLWQMIHELRNVAMSQPPIQRRADISPRVTVYF